MTAPVLISRDHLEQLAFDNPDALIEFTEDAAFLTVDGRTFYTLLTPMAEHAIGGVA